ncbi:MAG: hypothetical protein F6J93_28875 [Oscillatoria sp. SIO1A7]|nr:hypothetical protein [Oscillatoria sp. SIO1A7]
MTNFISLLLTFTTFSIQHSAFSIQHSAASIAQRIEQSVRQGESDRSVQF